MNHHPGESQEFDWVTARHECSLGLMFFRLQKGAEKDVEARNKLRIAGEPGTWHVQLQESGHFIAYRESVIPFRAVEFDLTQTSIVIRDHEGKWDFVATITLNDLGECMLLVDGKQLYEWQVRKRALEALLF
jgi:hypothetical protein